MGTHSVLPFLDNSQIGICPCNICPRHIRPYQQYLSCYWPDFDQILKVGSWDLFEHIPSVTMIFVQETLVLATFVHISNISAVTDPILTKPQSPGASLTDVNCHGDIFPGNI